MSSLNFRTIPAMQVADLPNGTVLELTVEGADVVVSHRRALGGELIRAMTLYTAAMTAEGFDKTLAESLSPSKVDCNPALEKVREHIKSERLFQVVVGTKAIPRAEALLSNLGFSKVSWPRSVSDPVSNWYILVSSEYMQYRIDHQPFRGGSGINTYYLAEFEAGQQRTPVQASLVHGPLDLPDIYSVYLGDIERERQAKLNKLGNVSRALGFRKSTTEASDKFPMLVFNRGEFHLKRATEAPLLPFKTVFDILYPYTIGKTNY